MNTGDDSQRLLIIPCCARKKAGGQPWQPNPGSWEDVVDGDIRSRVLTGRMMLADEITRRHDQEPKHIKNLALRTGPDFGGQDIYGEYLPAVDRYSGTLYTAYPGMSDLIKRNSGLAQGIHILILSALYGPLHPLDSIQDYNLTMGDRHARRTWSEIFPVFLASFVKALGIKQIELFLGKSTPYYRIAHRAVLPLVEDSPLVATLHDIQNGNLRETPRNHGLILAQTLGLSDVPPLTRETIARGIHA